MSIGTPSLSFEEDIREWPWWRPIRKSDIAPTAAGAVTASGQLAPTGVCKQVIGWAIKETTGSVGATFTLWDGVNTEGTVIVPITLSANESTRDRSGPPGIQCVSGGLYLQVISGSISGVVYWI